mgnify:CR=1 FL=1
MPVIGVDISGQVGSNPPVYAVAVKLRREEQYHHIVCLTPARHDEYRSSARNWCEKLSAILIYKATLELYNSGDAIVIDVDFMGNRRIRIENCLKTLFGTRFLGQHPLNDPNILFVPPRLNIHVKKAHVKSRLARHRGIAADLKDPDLSDEFDWLEKL